MSEFHKMARSFTSKLLSDYVFLEWMAGDLLVEVLSQDRIHTILSNSNQKHAKKAMQNTVSVCVCVYVCVYISLSAAGSPAIMHCN